MLYFIVLVIIIYIQTRSISQHMQKHSLYLITGNAKKLQEFKQILGDQFDFQNQNIDLPQIQGDPEEVAKEKVLIAYKQAKKAVLTQDTSLCFNAYKGLPGPYIKWFLKSINCEGLAKMVQPFEDKTAYAMCILSYMGPELKQPILFIGKTPGKIVEPRGSRDFGWDPVFQPEGFDKTYAELPKEIKNTISHRYRAIKQLQIYFANKKTQMKDQKSENKQVQNEKAKAEPSSEIKNQKPEKSQKKEKSEKKQNQSKQKKQPSADKQQKDQPKKRETRSGQKTNKDQPQSKTPKKEQKKQKSASKPKGK